MKTIKIHNVETGEIIEREMTIEELEQQTQQKLANEVIKEAKTKAQAQRSVALAKLEALGLDADDLKALGL